MDNTHTQSGGIIFHADAAVNQLMLERLKTQKKNNRPIMNFIQKIRERERVNRVNTDTAAASFVFLFCYLFVWFV